MLLPKNLFGLSLLAIASAMPSTSHAQAAPVARFITGLVVSETAVASTATSKALESVLAARGSSAAGAALGTATATTSASSIIARSLAEGRNTKLKILSEDLVRSRRKFAAAEFAAVTQLLVESNKGDEIDVAHFSRGVAGISVELHAKVGVIIHHKLTTSEWMVYGAASQSRMPKPSLKLHSNVIANVCNEQTREAATPEAYGIIQRATRKYLSPIRVGAQLAQSQGDVVQEVFARLLERCEALLQRTSTDGKIRDEGAFLATMAANEIRMFLRRCKSGPRVCELDASIDGTDVIPGDTVRSQVSNPEQIAQVHEEIRFVTDIVRGLSQRQRQTLALLLQGGRSGEEMAKALGISVDRFYELSSLVRKNISKAMKAVDQVNAVPRAKAELPSSR